MNKDFDLTGYCALITGGGGLLALEHALVLAEYGATVVLSDVNTFNLERNKKSLETKGFTNVVCLKHDVTDKGSWMNLVNELSSNGINSIDVLVNNAAFTNASQSSNYSADFFNFDLENWESILRVNLTGTFLGCQVIGNLMKVKGYGSIINVASLYGVVSPHHPIYPGTGISQPVAYSVSKSGVLGLTRYLATMLAPSKIRVNCITPGGIFDGQSEVFVKRFQSLCPTGEMQSKTDLRGALLLLASPAGSQIIGQNIIVDGGWTVW